MFKVHMLIMVVCLHLISGSRMKYDLPIKYPGPTKNVSNRYGTVDVPEECKDLNYCTVKPPDYPQEMFDKMFKGSKLGKLPNLVIPSQAEIDLGNRQGGPGELDDCRATVTYEPLYKVRNKRTGDWRVVVNSEQENYVQKVRLETCSKPDTKCFIEYPEAIGYETFCKQKYNDWEIMVSDGQGNTETITTALPVCCSCHYRAVPLGNRFGKPNN
ncbi:uncharacterized protein isoform X2 [Choristoneura fumiferana]|uniref:uncharacterized protein isoform X2 n=1 Tax=Choristoneura fumiferana TaxID=7141 RepID=UPI003D1580C2